MEHGQLCQQLLINTIVPTPIAHARDLDNVITLSFQSYPFWFGLGGIAGALEARAKSKKQLLNVSNIWKSFKVFLFGPKVSKRFWTVLNFTKRLKVFFKVWPTSKKKTSTSS